MQATALNPAVKNDQTGVTWRLNGQFGWDMGVEGNKLLLMTGKGQDAHCLLFRKKGQCGRGGRESLWESSQQRGRCFDTWRFVSSLGPHRCLRVSFCKNQKDRHPESGHLQYCICLTLSWDVSLISGCHSFCDGRSMRSCCCRCSKCLLPRTDPLKELAVGCAICTWVAGKLGGTKVYFF